MKTLTVWFIRIYQLVISPLILPRCRHFPTCSEYAMQAVGKHGALRGLYFTVRRLLRCHPFTPGGYDPVP